MDALARLWLLAQLWLLGLLFMLGVAALGHFVGRIIWYLSRSTAKHS